MLHELYLTGTGLDFEYHFLKEEKTNLFVGNKFPEFRNNFWFCYVKFHSAVGSTQTSLQA